MATKNVAVETMTEQEIENAAETKGRYTFYLRAQDTETGAGRAAEQVARIERGVKWDSQVKYEAGDRRGSDIAYALYQELMALKTERAEMLDLKVTLSKIGKAQRGMITCYPTNHQYKGCGGMGTFVKIGDDGTIERRTCNVCGGKGEIERRREANELLERIARPYGTLTEAIVALAEAYENNRFSPVYLKNNAEAIQAEYDAAVARREARRAAEANDDVPF